MTDNMGDENNVPADRCGKKRWSAFTRRDVPYYAQTGEEYSGTYYGGGPAENNFFGEITLQRLLRVVQKKWLTITLST
ncbi:MAG: hypothetical protein PHP44_15310, partial [Kiritimatiellae bacterium]|nr:hypothetical protein [Kiritimatiellia bacterium]